MKLEVCGYFYTRRAYMKIRSAWHDQGRQAHKRGIEWDFSFDDWCGWWVKHLGPNWFWMRGRRKGQYVMARYYDDGPYVIHNVKCIKSEDNVKEARSTCASRR